MTMITDEAARTIYAKGFPKTVVVTEASVRGLFEGFGKVRSVKLRRDEKTNAFRGSVYVEFEKETAAIRAVQSPPLMPGARERLSVMLRAEYERRASQYETSTKYGSRTAPSAGLTLTPSKRMKMEMGLSGTPDVLSPSLVASSGGKSVAYWQHVAEEKEKRIKELDEALKIEKEVYQKTSQEKEEAYKREQLTARKLLSKEVEVGTLKGEVTALRQSMHAKLDAETEVHNARVHDLENRLELQKKEIALLRQQEKEREKESKGVTPGQTLKPPPSPPVDPLDGDLN